MNEKNKSADGQENPAIVMNTQYIKDLSLEIPHAPEIFREIKAAPQVNIDVDVKSEHMHDNYYNVALNIRMDGDANDKKLFIVELEYACVVSLNVPQEHLEPVLMIDIPRLIFPYARAIITNSLVEGGLPPFMINPIDFVTMYNNRKNKK